ncbi:hypothetical protein Tco_0793904 [Tanacetum coccineum]
MVLNSPCFTVKSWLVQDQTVPGKDKSNLLIADSLLKTIWFINAPCYGNEALASPKANELTIPEQTATGKGTSNPFMAGPRCKEIDDVGEVSTIWKSRSVGVLKLQDDCSTHNLAQNKLNMENLPSKISREFLILIL